MSPSTITILLAAILLNFTVFRIVSYQERSSVTAAVESILRNEYSTASSYQLSRSLGDLERLKILTCVKLVELSGLNRTYYDTSLGSNCSHLTFTQFLNVSRSTLAAGNGLHYQLNYEVPVRWQNILLEVIGYLLSVFSTGLYKWRARQHRLKKNLEQAKAEQLAEQAMQVLHDIRSPLAALDIVMLDAVSLPEDQRDLIRSATKGIKDIANDLLRQGSATNIKETRNGQKLNSIFDSVVSEKQLLHRGKTEVRLVWNFSKFCDLECEDSLGQDLRRILSNLIENAMEATSKGQVSVSTYPSGDQIVLEIADTGKGIPDHILAQLGKRGFTFGKSQLHSGTGLGLYHAFLKAREWNGSLSISSVLNKGSIFKLSVPASRFRNYLQASIPLDMPRSAPSADQDNSNVSSDSLHKLQELGAKHLVVLIDNDPANHLAWKLAARKYGKEFMSFSAVPDLLNELDNIETDADIFIDLHLGLQDLDGLGVAKILSARGYSNLFITTGANLGSISRPRWVKAIIGKSPPWL